MTPPSSTMPPAAAGFVADVDRHMRSLVSARTGSTVDAALATIDAGGKRIRPLLVRAARPRSLDSSPADAATFDACSIRVAAAIELVHTASLVHDDLLDEAPLRRGVATTWHEHGGETAVATGDLLFALAFETLVRCADAAGDAVARRCTRVLARTARTLAEGEAMQAAQVRDPYLSEEAYLARCRDKTGVLFGAALQLGAIVGGAELGDVDLLGRFGTAVGISFQVADDVLDCTLPGADDAVGKQPGTDLLDGTITLPMLLAVQADESLAAAFSSRIEPVEVDALLERMHVVGAVDTVRRRAIELRDDAVLLLDELQGRFDTGQLLGIADGAARRSS